eukprot:8496345-Pyramimonas_sp.AAC.1
MADPPPQPSRSKRFPKRVGCKPTNNNGRKVPVGCLRGGRGVQYAAQGSVISLIYNAVTPELTVTKPRRSSFGGALFTSCRAQRGPGPSDLDLFRRRGRALVRSRETLERRYTPSWGRWGPGSSLLRGLQHPALRRNSGSRQLPPVKSGKGLRSGSALQNGAQADRCCWPIPANNVAHSHETWKYSLWRKFYRFEVAFSEFCSDGRGFYCF